MPIVFEIEDDGKTKSLNYNENITVEDFIKDYLKENSMFVSTSTKDYSFMLGSKLLNAERFLNKQLKQVIQTGSSVTLIRKNDLHYSLINTIPLL